MSAAQSVDAVIVPPLRDLGDGFKVRRALPSAQRRMIGPFVFFDQMGPTVFEAGRGLDVRPHPHIGLATVTYLLEGEIVHRDSLGSDQAICPGAVNWMVAGRGIVHSERTASAARASPSPLAGVQIWVALPEAQQETAPSFTHHPADTLPRLDDAGLSLRLIAGALAGVRAPVAVFSDLFLADLHLAPGARWTLPTTHEERALYALEGRLEIDGVPYEAGQLIVLQPGAAITLGGGRDTRQPTRLLALGGAPIGRRYVWWNFVSSSRERIEKASEDWREQRFGAVDGDPEFIPLPQTPPPPPDYP